ncbi:hypothetical protein GGR56DRAFT_191243 [Xylariaceae sp. FL0804]|nr:hypothetical protein GGR56DRAFT_191243 [Xylariaceae sp. FL0804]
MEGARPDPQKVSMGANNAPGMGYGAEVRSTCSTVSLPCLILSCACSGSLVPIPIPVPAPVPVPEDPVVGLRPSLPNRANTLLLKTLVGDGHVMKPHSPWSSLAHSTAARAPDGAGTGLRRCHWPAASTVGGVAEGLRGRVWETGPESASKFQTIQTCRDAVASCLLPSTAAPPPARLLLSVLLPLALPLSQSLAGLQLVLTMPPSLRVIARSLPSRASVPARFASARLQLLVTCRRQSSHRRLPAPSLAVGPGGECAYPIVACLNLSACRLIRLHRT